MITVDIPDIKKIERQLGQYRDQAPTVLSRAINGAAKSARRTLADRVKKTYTVKVSGVSKDLKLKKATKGRLYADLNSKGKPIPLSQYKVSPPKPVKGSVEMHQAKNIKENSMKDLIKQLGGSEMKGFTAKMKSGHVGMFVRVPGKYLKSYSYPNRKRKYIGPPHSWRVKTTHGRNAITELFGPSMPQMIGGARVAEKYLENEIEKVLYKHVMAEIDRVKAGGGK